jgi:hypothetical protein
MARNGKCFVMMGRSAIAGTQTTATIHRQYCYDTTPFSWDWRAPNWSKTASAVVIFLRGYGKFIRSPTRPSTGGPCIRNGVLPTA